MTEEQPKKRRRLLPILGGLVVLCLFCFVVVILLPDNDEATPVAEAPTEISQSAAQSTEAPEEPKPTQGPSNTPEPSNTPAPTNTSEPTPIPTQTPEPREQLRVDIREILGTGNRDVTKLTDFSYDCIDSVSICVTFAIDDNLTENFIKRGAMLDINRMLEIIAQSDIEYEEVFFTGTFPLVDAFGNSEETNVVMVWYRKETVDKINWDNFLTDNVYIIADDLFLHPAFREE